MSVCYPNIKSITTSFSHESDALFGMRPDISTCTEESKRSYISSFIFGMTEYEGMVKLEYWYREQGDSKL